MGVVPRAKHLVQDIELTVTHCSKLSIQGHSWWNKELSCLQASTRQHFNQAKGEVTGNHMRWPSPVITKRLERSNDPLGGTAVRGWRMYLTEPNSWGSWPVSHPTGWNLLQYWWPIRTICKWDHEGTKKSSFSRVCSRKNDVGRERQPNLTALLLTGIV